MNRVNIKNSVIALAIGLIMISCGGRGGNQQSGTATTETTQVESKGGNNSARWPADRFKPYNIPEYTAGSVGAVGNESVYICNTTRDECLAYLKSLVAAGIKDDETEDYVDLFEGGSVQFVRIVLSDGKALNVMYTSTPQMALGVEFSVSINLK